MHETQTRFRPPRVLGRMVRFAPVLLLLGCSPERAPEEPIRPVRTQLVRSAGAERVRLFSGVARASVDSRLSFRVAGTIQRLAVKVGDSVVAGQLLARLDPRDYELQVEGADAALAQARARARNADANLERIRGLYENNNASQNEYDSVRAEAEFSAAQVESAANKLELARSQLSYTRLTAPAAGAISAVTAEVNENASPGQTIAVLSTSRRPEVEVAVPETFIAQINGGQEVAVTFDSMPERRFTGIVTEVGVSPGDTGTTYPVRMRIDDPDNEILPGMAAEVAFHLHSGSARDRMTVPPHAVTEDREGRFVFVAEPRDDGLATARRRAVRVGDLTADGLEILDGLQEGEHLITAGVSRIEDGMTVKLPIAPGTGE